MCTKVVPMFFFTAEMHWRSKRTAKALCYLLCSRLCFTFFGNEWPKRQYTAVAQAMFMYLYNRCQDIFVHLVLDSQSCSHAPPSKGSLTLTPLQRGEPGNDANDSYWPWKDSWASVACPSPPRGFLWGSIGCRSTLLECALSVGSYHPGTLTSLCRV